MPFDPPDTVYSVGTTGYLSIFAVGDTASPPNYTALGEVKSFNFTPLDVPNVDFTHLLSPLNTREIRPGMIMPGKVEVSGNYIGDAGQLAIPTDAQNQTVFPVQITVPVQNREKTLVFTANAFVSSFKLGPFENDKPNEFSASFQIAGGYQIVTEA